MIWKWKWWNWRSLEICRVVEDCWKQLSKDGNFRPCQYFWWPGHRDIPPPYIVTMKVTFSYIDHSDNAIREQRSNSQLRDMKWFEGKTGEKRSSMHFLRCAFFLVKKIHDFCGKIYRNLLYLKVSDNDDGEPLKVCKPDLNLFKIFNSCFSAETFKLGTPPVG